MKQYLKMADVIDGFVLTSGVRCVIIGGSEQQSSALILAVDSKTADYTAHAINSHDELVQMNQELLAALEALFHETNQQNLSVADNVIAKAKGGAA